MVQKPVNKENNGVTPRSKSSLMPRRRRDERKKSAEHNSRRSVIHPNRLGNYKPTSSAFSIISGPERIKQLNEITTNETYTNNTKKKSNISKFEVSERSDNLSSMYASNHSTNIVTQLKSCCKNFNEKTIKAISKVSPTLPTIRIMFAIIKIMQSMGEKIKSPTDWIQITKIVAKKEKRMLS